MPGEIVGFPAVLGLEHPREVWHELETNLGRPVFEVPTLPPSVQGLRLFDTMTTALRREGGRLVVGSAVAGAESGGNRLESVVAQTACRTRLASSRATSTSTHSHGRASPWTRSSAPLTPRARRPSRTSTPRGRRLR